MSEQKNALSVRGAWIRNKRMKACKELTDLVNECVEVFEKLGF
ncbi:MULTISPECIES: hypothetical protein [unclassified Bacillus (in: firmicutes)]|nr:hypothetical protein [Bacillus sp. AFS059628]